MERSGMMYDMDEDMVIDPEMRLVSERTKKDPWAWLWWTLGIIAVLVAITLLALLIWWIVMMAEGRSDFDKAWNDFWANLGEYFGMNPQSNGKEVWWEKIADYFDADYWQNMMGNDSGKAAGAALGGLAAGLGASAVNEMTKEKKKVSDTVKEMQKVKSDMQNGKVSNGDGMKKIADLKKKRDMHAKKVKEHADKISKEHDAKQNGSKNGSKNGSSAHKKPTSKPHSQSNSKPKPDGHNQDPADNGFVRIQPYPFPMEQDSDMPIDQDSIPVDFVYNQAWDGSSVPTWAAMGVGWGWTSYPEA